MRAARTTNVYRLDRHAPFLVPDRHVHRPAGRNAPASQRAKIDRQGLAAAAAIIVAFTCYDLRNSCRETVADSRRFERLDFTNPRSGLTYKSLCGRDVPSCSAQRYYSLLYLFVAD